MDDFTVAHDVTLDLANTLTKSGLAPEQVAESLIVVGLALWGAHNNRKESAEAVLRVFDYERGANFGN